MIAALRKIRKRLLDRNKFSSYFLYAIGEILLVVVGILIALQINNWNEKRKQDQLEKVYLASLKEEFQDNLKEVDRVIALNNSIFKNALDLSQYTGPDDPEISDQQFAKLLFGAINAEVQYRPGTGVINEIISSGKLNIFRSDQLKKALASLDGLLLKVRFQEKEELGDVRLNLSALIQNADVSSRKMVYDAYGENFGLDGGKFNPTNRLLLKNMQFDNLLTQFIYTSGYLDSRYKELKKEIEEIIVIIED